MYSMSAIDQTRSPTSHTSLDEPCRWSLWTGAQRSSRNQLNRKESIIKKQGRSKLLHQHSLQPLLHQEPVQHSLLDLKSLFEPVFPLFYKLLSWNSHKKTVRLNTVQWGSYFYVNCSLSTDPSPARSKTIHWFDFPIVFISGYDTWQQLLPKTNCSQFLLGCKLHREHKCHYEVVKLIK